VVPPRRLSWTQADSAATAPSLGLKPESTSSQETPGLMTPAVRRSTPGGTGTPPTSVVTGTMLPAASLAAWLVVCVY